MKRIGEREFRRILIIKPSSPGDIIHALPVLHGLRRRYPKAHLAWLVASGFADLLGADPALNEVIAFDRKRFGRLGRSWEVTTEFAGFVMGLRARRFDLVVDLQGLFRSGFFAAASGAGVRIGFARAREFSPWFYTHRLREGDEAVHAADKNYLVADLLGFGEVGMDFGISLTGEDREYARRLAGEAGIGAGGRYALMATGTRWETKCWSAERFGELAAAIQGRHGLGTILVGGRDDGAGAEEAARASQGAARSLCGRTSLRQLAALVEGAAIVVTGDSTPMHVAAAMGRPLVALFGPTNPKRTGPHGRGEDVIRLALPCSPCYLRSLSQCPHDHACMRDLEVERVMEAVGRRLGRS